MGEMTKEIMKGLTEMEKRFQLAEENVCTTSEGLCRTAQ